MSKLDELIKELCPNGVEYKKVENCIISLKTGLNPRQNFKLNQDGDNCPYITGKDIFDSKINITERTDKISNDAVKIINRRSNLEKGNLLFASTGTGTVGRMAIIESYNNDWNISETLYSLKVEKFILSKYLMYFLYTGEAKAQFEPKISKGSVPHLKVCDLLNVIVPIAPLPVQEEIVRILDTFTSLTAELTAELTARRKQYEYYRDSLLTRETKVEVKKMQDICDFVTVGIANSATHAYSDNGVLMFRNQNIKENYLDDKDLVYITPEFEEKYKNKRLKENDILVTRTGYPGVACVVPKNYEGCQTFTTLIARLSDLSKISPKYVCYYINSGEGKKYVNQKKSGAAQQNFGATELSQMPIPLPPLDVQERIVNVLDNFDSICTDLKIGLPAEIEARKKQYEYYRDFLLTFASSGNTILSEQNR